MSSHNQYEGAATNNAHDHTVGSAAHSDAHIEQGKAGSDGKSDSKSFNTLPIPPPLAPLAPSAPSLDYPPLSELPQYTPNTRFPPDTTVIQTQPLTTNIAIPHYVDLSIIPKEAYCYRENVPFIGNSSHATVKANESEIVTYDPLCDTSEELWRYFLTYLTKPVLILDLEVHHEESRSVRDSTGNMKQEKYRVTDLAAKIDFGKYIRPDYDWNFIVATDSSKPPAAVSFQAALDGYCDLQSSFKEITLQKQLNWDLKAFEKVVKNLLRNHPSWRYTLYTRSFTAKFRYQNHLVTARSPSKWSTFSHNGFVRFLCVISCLWIFAWPLFCLLRKRSKNKLMAMWESTQPWQDAFAQNHGLIENIIISRHRSNQPVIAL